MKKVIIGLLFLVSSTNIVNAQGVEAVPEKEMTMKAEVLEILKQGTVNIPGTDVEHSNQTIKVKVVDGEEKGKVVVVENDYLDLEVGEVFYLRHTKDTFGGADYYAVDEPYRMPRVLFLVGLFVVLVIIFGGIQGVRGIVSLFGSLILILYVLLPGILSGYSPLLVTIGVSSLIIIVGSYITHGFNKTTSCAVIGMIITVSITGALAFWAVHFTRLSGYGSDEMTYLNINSGGQLDILGLLLGGIMIGLLGVLYDIAIGQAISVEELIRIAPHVPKKTIYQRATRIGREHIGALVNTLAIAYVGTALPLLLLFYQASSSNAWVTMNRELFATEIVRTMIGSIGLVLAVPITTAVSVWVLMKKVGNVDKSVIEKEKHDLQHVEHGHSH